jgi:DNA adenine methylase
MKPSAAKPIAPARDRTPRPILKWVGGKGQLLNEILVRVEMLPVGFRRYHEPFVGGGAVFFEMARRNMLPRAKACISDNNPRLIAVYQGVQQDVDAVIARLERHKKRHHDGDSKAYYYKVRAQQPDNLIDQAARIIYLNKTGYNGLYRENSKGLFNVPFGRYKNPAICDEANLRAVAEALSKHAKLAVQSFGAVLGDAEPGDLVYFDPPYDPVSKTASFTSYAQGGFGELEQRELAETYATLAERGVYVLLSNSSTKLIRHLYKDFNIDTVYATRAVNTRADRRGKVSEVLVRNF